MRIFLLLLSFPAFAEMAPHYKGGFPFVYALNRGVQSGTVACGVSFARADDSGDLKVTIHRDDDIDFSMDVIPAAQIDKLLSGAIPRVQIKHGDLTFLAEMDSTANQKVMFVNIRSTPSGFYPVDRSKGCQILPESPEKAPTYLERAGEMPILQ